MPPDHEKEEVSYLEDRGDHVIHKGDLVQDGDDAAKVLEGQNLDDATPEEIKKLVRKQDLILVPLMAVGVGMLLVDKTALGSAATLNLQADLGLVGTQYNWAVSMYFFGLLVGTYPASLLLQKFHSGRVVGIAYLLWGSVMLGTMGVQNYQQLFAVRFLLGILESCNNPAFTLITARFWTQQEQPIRYSLWAVGNTVMPIPFLLIFYGLGTLPAHPFAQWRWIFLVLGLTTIVVGVIMFLLFPDKPSNCIWLTERQRVLAVARIARSQTGIKSHVFKRYQVIEALTDIKVWLCAFMLVCQQPAPSIVTNFSGIIIKGYGYTGLQSLLLQIPSWAVPCVGTPLVGFLGTFVPFFRTRKTFLLIIVSIISLTSEIILYLRPPVPGSNKAIPLTFISLLSLDQSIYPIVMALVGQNSGGATKKQTSVAIVWLLYCVCNIAYPQAFKASESPRYQSGVLTTAGAQAVLILLAVAFYIICTIDNRKRDKALEEIQAGPDSDQRRVLAGLQDETDKRNPLFRYYA